MDSTTVDPGLAGFLGIAREGADAEPTPDAGTDTLDAAQTDAAAADAAPEEAPDQDLPAAEVVAARLAASLDEPGIEAPDPESAAAAPPEGEHPLLTEAEAEFSYESLTEEQKRALAEEAIRLRGEVSTKSQQDAANKVREAEEAAASEVQSAYEQNVLAVARRHYAGVFKERLAALMPTVSEEELPARAMALAEQVWDARQQWVDQQGDAYEELAKERVLAARYNAPEFRQYAAEKLVAEAGLPPAAAAEVLKTTNTADFPARVQELVGIRDALLAERARSQQRQREEGRQRLAADAPRTAATGRPRGGKPPEYRGVAAEGVAIVRQIRQ